MRSIRRRLSWGLWGSLSILILVCVLVLFLVLRQALVQEFDAAQLSAAKALMVLVEQEDEGTIEFEPAIGRLPHFTESEAAEYLQIWLEDGSVLARSESLKDFDLERRAGPIDDPAIWDLGLPHGRPGRAVGVRFTPMREIQEEGEVSPEERQLPVPAMTAVLVYARAREPLDRTLGILLLALLALVLILPICAAFLVRHVVVRGLRPLNRISREIQVVDPTNLTHRFSPDHIPEELLPIANRLNELLIRLEEAFERERRFTSGVAHELRTPIAELRTLAEVGLQARADSELTRPEANQTFEDALAIALQMDRIVSTLLHLLHVQSGEQLVHADALDLVALIQETWQSHETIARERGVTAYFRLPDQATLHTDKGLLVAILSNLFSNAVAHTPKGGRVSCRLQTLTDRLTLTIANRNSGLERDDLTHIFEPFWQKDPARSSSSHFGLGLAVVETYAQALGFEVAADLPQPDLFEITLRLPR